MLFFYRVFLCVHIIVATGIYCSENNTPITFHVHLPQMTQNQTTNAHSDMNNSSVAPNAISNILHNDPVTSTHNNAQSVAHNQTHVITKIDLVLSVYQQLSAHLQQIMTNTHNNARNIWDSHKHKIMVLMAGGIYTTFFLYFLCNHHYIKNQSLWGNWRNIDDHIDHIVDQKLIVEIQNRYMISQDPNNFMLPIISFLKDIETQEKRISHYIYYMQCFDKTFIRIFFLVNKSKITYAQEFLARTQKIRLLFSNWLSQQKCNHYTRNKEATVFANYSPH